MRLPASTILSLLKLLQLHVHVCNSTYFVTRRLAEAVFRQKAEKLICHGRKSNHGFHFKPNYFRIILRLGKHGGTINVRFLFIYLSFQEQCDLIGRFFVFRVHSSFQNYRNTPHFWATFSTVKVMPDFEKKFGRFFSQTHLVTLST
jgi:hypothetical protein